MKKKILTVLVMMMSIAGFAQDVSVPPNVLDAATLMFQDANPPFKLEFKVDFNMNTMGFKVMNYTMYSNDVEIGIVSRIMALHSEGSAKNVDMLVRYGAEGEILNMINLKPWKINGKTVNITPLMQMLAGKKMDDLRSPLNVLLNGLAAGATMQDAEPLAAPPKDFVLNLKQKILEPGATIPPMNFISLDDSQFSTKSMNGPFAMFFISLQSSRCEDMIKSIEFARTGFPQNPELANVAKTMKVLYIIGGTKDKVAAFAERNKMDKSTVVCDPIDQLQKLYQIPFKPYGLMYNKEGIMLNNVIWEGAEELLGTFYMLCGGKDDGEDD